MKRGTSEHPKMIELGALIERPLPFVLGTVQLLWDATSVYTPAGDIGRYSDATIESKCRWDGEHGHLVAALVRVRLLDEHPEHRLVIHDWPQHAEDSIHKALGRACRLFATGEEPKLGGLEQEEKARALEAFRIARAARTECNGALPDAPECNGALPAATSALEAEPSMELSVASGEIPATGGDRRRPAVAAGVFSAAGGDRRPPAVAVAVAVASTTTEPPQPPRFAGGPRGRPPESSGARIAAQVDELAEYAIQLGVRPGRKERRRYREAIRAGHSMEQLKGSIAEMRRDVLISAGKLDPTAEWPPPGLAPFDGVEAAAHAM